MKLSDFKDKKKILIFGCGKEGQATLDFLRYFFPEKEFIVADKRDGDDYLDKQEGCDIAIRTPGMRKESISIPHTTATNIFFANVAGLTIGITGTKGKSTTSSLIHAILRKAGKESHLVGNIGNPMLSELLSVFKKQGISDLSDLDAYEKSNPEDIYVCELSSYQLDDIEYSPDISVILNLYSDHMDYHGGVEAYKKAKANIVRYADEKDFLVYDPDFSELVSLARRSRAKAVAYPERLPFDAGKSKLIGRHNADNMRAAVAVSDIVGIDHETVRKTVESFEPLPHRLEFVREVGGVSFYDDAISTTPESTIAAIESIGNVRTILLGGLDRGYDFSGLAKTISESGIKNVALFPNSGKRIEAALAGNASHPLNVAHFEDMDEAVSFAYRFAEKGTACLLSTASPSYSLWKNFEEKGDRFREAVNGLGE